MALRMRRLEKIRAFISSFSFDARADIDKSEKKNHNETILEPKGGRDGYHDYGEKYSLRPL